MYHLLGSVGLLSDILAGLEVAPYAPPTSKRPYQASWAGLQWRDWESWSERRLACGWGRVLLG